MSYLQDKKTKRKKFLTILSFVGLLLFLIYFRVGIWDGLSYVSQVVFRPIFLLGNNIGNNFSDISSFFYSKNVLIRDNENLKLGLKEKEAILANYNSLFDENVQMKEILGRKVEKTKMILSAILSKPNQSPYDTLVIDVGEGDNILVGKLVFALGNIPVGKIAEVYPNSSKVILFSNPGEKTEVVINKNIFIQIVGRGGGNFEMNLVKDLILEKGAEVILPGIIPYVVGIVQTTISDPRDTFEKALLVSPVNIQELKFVEVEK